MRVLIVGRRQAGETRRSIAGAVGVSPATVRKWLRRHESEGAAGLQDRTSRRIACARGSIRARETGLSRATVARVARAGNICIWPSTITRGWPILKFLPDETRRSCLKFLFNALRCYRDHGIRVLRVMTDHGVSFRSLSSRKGGAKNQAQAHQTLSAKKQRKGRTLRAELCGNGPTPNPPTIHPNGPPVAFPPQLQSSSASLRHQRMPP
jgi:hypothetical protein